MQLLLNQRLFISIFSNKLCGSRFLLVLPASACVKGFDIYDLYQADLHGTLRCNRAVDSSSSDLCHSANVYTREHYLLIDTGREVQRAGCLRVVACVRVVLVCLWL